MSWLMIVYKAPSQPSSARVSAWRRLHKLGALYTGPSTCLIPAALQEEDEIEAVAVIVRKAGGTFDAYAIEKFANESEATLIDRFNAERDAEYREVIERADALVAELEREASLEKFTYAEVEENEDALSNLRKWLARVRLRDVYGATGRAAAEAAVEGAHRHLEEFVSRAVERTGAGERRSSEGPPARRSDNKTAIDNK